MNVALTDRGRLVLSNEFKVLVMNSTGNMASALSSPRPILWKKRNLLPAPEAGPVLPMYLADWLEGFYEFHLSRDPADGKQKLVLWDSPATDHYLPGTVDYSNL